MEDYRSSGENQWMKNLWNNYNKNTPAPKNESLWSRVSEMVNAFNGELQMQRDSSRKMKPDSLPVGVDCTLSPVLLPPPPPIGSASETVIASSSNGNFRTVVTSEGTVKRLVCSPDLPVYPSSTSAQQLADHAITPTQTSSTLPLTAAIITTQKLYRCTICQVGFHQKVALNAHLKAAHKDSEDPYQCNFCGKTFAVPARLTRHYRTHTGEKPYQCEYCSKSFSVKENLSVHKRIHTKERPYKCSVCQRAFEHSGKLHRHMRIHTGERPHKCNFCSKTFIQSGQLVIHLRTHTGEKPYVCKCCNKGFTCSKQLKVHTRTHTGEKPYTCDICGKSFGYNHVLKLHQVAHYGEKVYKCTICKDTFSSKKAMETHIKVAHSESKVQTTSMDQQASAVPGGFSGVLSDKENAKIGEEGLDVTMTMTTTHHQTASSYYHHPHPPQPTLSNQQHAFDMYTQMASPLSDSTRSSPSPKMEIVETAELLPTHQNHQQQTVYFVSDAVHPSPSYEEQFFPSPMPPSVIINVPFHRHQFVTPPSSSDSTSPIPSSPEMAPPKEKREDCTLPPRKRSRMLYKSTPEERIAEDVNFRHSSVIHYAKAS